MLLRGSAHEACRVFGLVKWAQVSLKELLSLNEPQTVTIKTKEEHFCHSEGQMVQVACPRVVFTWVFKRKIRDSSSLFCVYIYTPKGLLGTPVQFLINAII